MQRSLIRVLALLAFCFAALPFASAGVVISNCPLGAPSDSILHTQATVSRELVFVCPFDLGHTATTRTYFITNDTSSSWAAYLFDVSLDDPQGGFNDFGWTNKGGVFTPFLIEGSGVIDVDGTDARILFADAIAPGERFVVRLRFADYDISTARVHGTPVNEPAALALVIASLLGVAAGRRRRVAYPQG